MLNKVALVGRLVRDPEPRQSSSVQVTRFSLAVERAFKSKSGERETDFINIVTFGRLAEVCAQYLKKGRLISVSGRIQTGSYTAQDGTKRYTTDIVADEVDFINITSRDTQSQQPAAAPSQGQYQQAPVQEPAYPDGFGIPMEGFEEIDDLDVPF
ncbi:MAG: single-stranded DNA-binding protein [Eubacteriaceae bacterium]|jgi:single-strand DNA-binding protein|nr:single-stranded DNA-binding protein [Eubacteriaceae bacterium]